MLLIQEVSLEDIPTIIDVFIKSYLESYTYLWEDEGQHYMSTQFNADKLKKDITDPNRTTYLLQFENEPMGVLQIIHDFSLLNYSSKQALKLDRIYLLKKARGKGIGKKTIQFVFEKAKSLNKEVVVLDSMEQDNPLKIYEKIGFEVEGKTILNLSYAKKEFNKMVYMVYHLNKLPN